MRPPFKLFPSKTLRDMVSERVLPMLLWVLCYAAVTHGAWFGWKDGIRELRNKTLTSIQENIRGGGDWIDQYVDNLARSINDKVDNNFYDKATSTILYCTTSTCDSLVNGIKNEPSLQKSSCFKYIKPQSKSVDEARILQREIAVFVKECPNGIIFYDASEGITYEEANMLIMLLGEGSLVYWGGKPLLATGMSFFLLIPGTHSQTWEQKTLLDASRQKVHDLVCEDTHAEEDRRTIAGSARALRRRFEFAIPVAESKDGHDTDLPLETDPDAETYKLEYDEYEIPVEVSEDLFDEEAPQSEPGEGARSEQSEDQETEQELPPENVFNMHEMGDALPPEGGHSWTVFPDWGIEIDLPWPGYLNEMITSAVVGLTTHGVVNWMTNRDVRSTFSPASLLTTITVSVINNLQKSTLQGDLQLVSESLHDLNQFKNITLNGSSTDNQGQGPQGPQDAREQRGSDEWQHLNETLSNIRRTIDRISEHTESMRTALDDCICENQINGWGYNHGNETLLDRSLKWLTSARDNFVTWMWGTIWNRLGPRAIRNALVTGNGWQLLGTAMLFYKVVAWTLSVLRNIRKAIMHIWAVIQGIWWVCKLFWYICRRDWRRSQQLFLSQTVPPEQPDQHAPPEQPDQHAPPEQPDQHAPPEQPDQQAPPEQPDQQIQNQVRQIDASVPEEPGRARQGNEIRPDPLPETRQGPQSGHLFQSLMEGFQSFQEGFMRRAEELEERLVSRQGRLEEIMEASILTIGQRVEAIEDRAREQHPHDTSPESREATEPKQHAQALKSTNRRRNEGPTIPSTPVDQAPAKPPIGKGPTIKNVHKMLPNRKEDLSQFTRRMTKLLDRIDDPIKYAIATERIFNIANTEIQSRLRGLPWGDADNWTRVQRIIDECLQAERTVQNVVSLGQRHNVRPEYGHTCEQGHPMKGCPMTAEAFGTQRSGTVAQAIPDHNQSSRRMSQYNVPLSMEKITGKISCLLDSGAQTNILPAKLARKHNLVLKSTKIRTVTSFNNQTTNTCGEISLVCTLGNKGAEIPFVVCEGVQRPILGLRTLQAFKLQLNCDEDCVYDGEGNKILIHNVSVSKN